MILLALGHWLEGFEEFELCEREPPFQRPTTAAALALGKQPWRGESLEGKRLLLLHDHGFGDTIMMLRFVEMLRRHGAQVIQCVPAELEWLALQFGDVVDLRCPCDYFVSYLQLLRWLRIVPCSVPIAPYIRVSGDWQAHWRQRLGPKVHKRVGVAWSVRTEHSGDFPRPLPLQQIAVWFPDAELHSVQKQGVEEAAANGVATHELLDFASTAALMMQMDEIVTVDTAAAHLAGAIGHPNVTLMLSQWHSWRWHDNPFYPHVRMVESGR
jgi:hypothetical protein